MPVTAKELVNEAIRVSLCDHTNHTEGSKIIPSYICLFALIAQYSDDTGPAAKPRASGSDKYS